MQCQTDMPDRMPEDLPERMSEDLCSPQLLILMIFKFQKKTKKQKTN